MSGASSTLSATSASSFSSSSSSSLSSSSVFLSDILSFAQSIAPLDLSAKWDNTGLLVEPSVGASKHAVAKVTLTIDLTAEVLDSAIRHGSNVIIAYHPPIFSAFKRLTNADAKSSLIVRAIENRIAIFSPHTSWDAMIGGINDWLARGIVDEKNTASLDSIENHVTNVECVRVDIQSSHTDKQLFSSIINSFVGSQPIDNKSAHLPKKLINDFEKKIKEIDETATVFVTSYTPIPSTQLGVGRILRLNNSVSLQEIIHRVKSHLHLSHLRVSLPANSSLSEFAVKSIAICAGSGASVFSGVSANLYLTGEMSHHEVLAAKSKGIAVILAEHSNTERGFLQIFKEKLQKVIADKKPQANIDIQIADNDADPLVIV